MNTYIELTDDTDDNDTVDRTVFVELTTDNGDQDAMLELIRSMPPKTLTRADYIDLLNGIHYRLITDSLTRDECVELSAEYAEYTVSLQELR